MAHESLAPGAGRGLADAHLAADLLQSRVALDLLQGEHDLLFGELRLLYGEGSP